MAGLTISNVTSTYIRSAGKKVDESVSKTYTRYLTVNYDSSYPSGGEDFDGRTYSLTGILEPFFVSASIAEAATANAALYVKYDKQAHKLLVYVANAEGTGDLSGYTVTLKLEYLY